MHKPSLLFLSEIKLSSPSKFSHIVKLIGFLCFEVIPAIGSSGGITLLWKNFMDVWVLVANNNLVNVLNFSDGSDVP